MLAVQVDAIVWVGVVVVVAAVGLLVVLITPWKGIRDEPPLDADIEARLLLGEDPAAIAVDADAADAADAGRRAVVDLDPNRPHDD